MRHIEAPTIDDIRAARERIASLVTRTPLVRLQVDAPSEIYLKLENLQPIGSFKLRGAGNAIARLNPRELREGVYTASAGNMAQGVAWSARALGVDCEVVMPDSAPRTKVEAVERLGGRITKVPFAEWWQTLADFGRDGMQGRFIHPVADPDVMAGNGTIGLEILEDLPDVDTVLVPFGGGGLTSGIATAIRAVSPRVSVFGCEVATSTPLTAALAAGGPVTVERAPSFVDGIGGRGVLPEMWPIVRELVAGALVASVDEVAAAVRLLVERARIVAEGAGATPVAVALAGRAGRGRVVCVVSGGNIDSATLADILKS
ncbi:MAG TPA: threonine/serine dehydratase [Gemmatimonadaceae bacterium]